MKYLQLNLSEILFRHVVPINLVLLAAFTVVEAITVGTVVSLYEVSSVVQALVLTLLITFGLTAYTFQTKRDFSNMGVGLVPLLTIQTE